MAAMGGSDHQSRPGRDAAPPATGAEAAASRGALDGVHDQRARAAAQIARTLKVWRKRGDGAPAGGDLEGAGPEEAPGAVDALDGGDDRAPRPPAIGAAAPSVGLKIFRVPDNSGDNTKVQPPNDRHFIRKVDDSTVKKDQNSVISSSVDVTADVAAIRAGSATVGQAPGGEKSYTVNGRTYGAHPNGVLYPISGTGIYQLSRGAFQALAIYNKFGLTPRAEEILKNIGTGAEEKKAAKDAFSAG
jgi:hypothetical protein